MGGHKNKRNCIRGQQHRKVENYLLGGYFSEYPTLGACPFIEVLINWLRLRLGH